MTVVRTSTRRYTGLAGDTKPTTSGVIKGAVFIETDTGAAFEYTGSAWVEVSPKTRT